MVQARENYYVLMLQDCHDPVLIIKPNDPWCKSDEMGKGNIEPLNSMTTNPNHSSNSFGAILLYGHQHVDL